MTDRQEDTNVRRRFTRPAKGRWVSGLWAGCSETFGAPVAALRWLSVAATALGVLVAVGLGIFDATLFGDPLSPTLRGIGLALSALMLLHYPVLALVTPAERSHWDFGSSTGAVLLCMAVGQAVGTLLSRYWTVAKAAYVEHGFAGWFSWPGDFQTSVGFGARDVVFVAFVVSASVFLWLQRSAVHRFFRSMHTGVVLVVTTTVAVGVGVLVPQIDGFEDPEQRVDLEREYADYQLFREVGYQKLPAQMMDGHEQYQAFRWAEGYFLYHMLHLYGIGMPEAIIPPQADQGLEAFGKKYGIEERDNRRKQMVAAFSGREKVNEIGTFIHANEDAFWRFFEVSTVLSLNRTYKSHWFAWLLTLLGVAVFFNTFKGGSLASLFKIQKLGFFVVHMGMLVLLFGGLTSKLFTDRGLLELHLGEGPQDTYYRHYSPRKLARLPFAVRLDHFARQDWKALEVHFAGEEFSSRVPRYTLWPGREIELDYVDTETGTRPRLRLEVEELHERVEVGVPFVSETEEGDEGVGVPLAEILVHDAHLRPDFVRDADAKDESERRTYLFPIDRSAEPYIDPEGAFRLAGAYGVDPAEHFPVEEGVLGFVEVSVIGDEMAPPQVYRVRLDDTIEVAGGYRIRFVDACADFGPGRGDQTGSTHPQPLEEQDYRFAALWLDVMHPDGGEAERRLVLEAVDDVEHGRQGRHLYRDVIVRMRWNAWSAPGPPRYLLHWGEGVEPSLLSEDGDRTAVTLGEALALPGKNRVVPRQLLHDATFEQNLTFLPPTEHEDDWDADFYATTPRGLDMRVVHEPDTEEEWEERVNLATTDFGQADRWFSGDGRFALVFLENSEMLPYEWRSVLSILEKDNSGRLYEVPLGSEEDREIRVNDYFKYGGYRFFQTNARPEDPTYSGIGVVYDPGIPIVLTGMYTIIAGTAIAFLIRPIVLARRKRTVVTT